MGAGGLILPRHPTALRCHPQVLISRPAIRRPRRASPSCHRGKRMFVSCITGPLHQRARVCLRVCVCAVHTLNGLWWNASVCAALSYLIKYLQPLIGPHCSRADWADLAVFVCISKRAGGIRGEGVGRDAALPTHFQGMLLASRSICC